MGRRQLDQSLSNNQVLGNQAACNPILNSQTAANQIIANTVATNQVTGNTAACNLGNQVLGNQAFNGVLGNQFLQNQVLGFQARASIEFIGIVLTRCSGSFLLIQNEVTAQNVDIEPILFTRLTDRQERNLEQGGVPLIPIIGPLLTEDLIGTGAVIVLPGITGTAEFKCVFFASDREAFLVFEVDVGPFEAIVLVRTDVCRAVRLVKRGLARCATIRCPLDD